MIGHRWIRGESRSHEKTVFGPLMEPAFLNGAGPRLDVRRAGLIANHASSGPAEDPRLERP